MLREVWNNMLQEGSRFVTMDDIQDEAREDEGIRYRSGRFRRDTVGSSL